MADQGVRFLVRCGALLRLPQPTVALAATYYHRHESFFDAVELAALGRDEAKGQGEGAGAGSRETARTAQMDTELLAATCLHLACKQSEVVRKLRDVVNVAFWVATDVRGEATRLRLDDTFWSLKDAVIQAELVLLRVLGFDARADLPFVRIAEVMAAQRDEVLDEHEYDRGRSASGGDGSGGDGEGGEQEDDDARRRQQRRLVRVRDAAQAAVMVANEAVLDRALCLGIICEPDGGWVLGLAASYMGMDAMGMRPRRGFRRWCDDFGGAGMSDKVSDAIDRITVALGERLERAVKPGTGDETSNGMPVRDAGSLD